MRNRLSRSTTVLLLTLSAAASGVSVAAAAEAPGTQQVSYRGLKLAVPAGWQVVDLEKNPRACVRLDRNAVFLGTPGADQDCPAKPAAERADVLVVEPVPAGSSAPVVEAGRPLPAPVVEAGRIGREFRAEVKGAALRVTGTYRDSAKALGDLIAGGSVDAAAVQSAPAAKRSLAAAGSPQAGAPVAPRAAAADTAVPSTEAVGQAFDTCAAPSSTAMDSWSASPYRTVGIYVGGAARACAQGNLTPAWVSGRAAKGWTFLPVYVGRQANSRYSLQIDTDLVKAEAQGAEEAADAVKAVTDLGFPRLSLVYSDVEGGYAAADSPRVLAYLKGWTNQVRSLGYRSGVYSSATGAVKDLGTKYEDPYYPTPDVIWSAAWNQYADLSDQGMGLAKPYYWLAGGRRVHQHRGDHDETWGGIRINIDSNVLDVSSAASDRTVKSGQRLPSGASLAGDSTTVTMQSDGDLVARLNTHNGPGPVLWRSGTSGTLGAYAVMQGDGNFVVYGPTGGYTLGGGLWSTGTYGSTNAKVQLQADGNLVVYRPDGSAAWGSGTYRVGQTFASGGQLGSGRWTQGVKDSLVMQADGNLVIYKLDGSAAWSTGTWNSPGAYLVLQADGNLVLYARGGGPTTGGALWSAGTWGNPGARLTLQDDGNLVIYRQDGSPVWSSGTWMG
ncbi:glycoside hydrolase domain-containing protein [Kitasatospora albolonga]|uniref:glycoside hydrolase domain-containing protein n=1 Tax=Kitasatospora albolonga TaxID=68173 RepID=UPI0031E68608